MLKKLCICLLLTTNAFPIQQSCSAKAEECKDPVTNAKHFKDRHCTCFTCESGTPAQKVLCTNDDTEAGKLQARVEPLEKSQDKKEVPAMNLTGWVKDEGGKAVFVNDKDKQAWTIENMDAVKGHEGHHVKVKAKLDEADHSLSVEKLTMMRKSKQTSEEQKKEAKREKE